MNIYRPSAEAYRVGVMGGTFDPIHYGHLAVAEEVRASLDLAEMVFIPAGEPPHKPGLHITPAQDRAEMVRLAIASNPRFTLSRVDLDRPGPSYTSETVRLLRQEWGEQTAIYFVIGWDSLEELHTWHEPEAILEQIAYLVAVHRPGYVEAEHYREQLEANLPGISKRLRTVPAPQLDISATDLRQRVAQHRPIKYQLPEAVEEYIIEHGLYQEQEQRQAKKQGHFHGTNAI